ncbi:MULTISPECIES: multidrug transporter [unclassified Brevibacterium]|uniref:homing endonuclease associated repeat-containing protein n=1 Tax=unclassified Brevibacterium TaxID=2614124 RepID=UPI001E3D81A6|nr:MULTISPECIES: multidrug transporter [unclassified Brevibacterium]MCD1286019.1 multidrug transporter [Brevibacterium sp. CCUG 69071]MDK8433370.1 multidrug transporter [Brevibacterium sp. H-BE7]
MNDHTADRSHTSSPAVLGALLYLAAEVLEPGFAAKASGTDAKSAGAGTKADAAVSKLNPRDQEILAEVELALASQLPDDSPAVTRTLAEVSSAIGFIRSRSEKPSLTAAKYDARRADALTRIGARSTKGASVWPPTSQTAVQRFGSWNDALKAAGLAISSVGRARGQLRFDAAAYDRAIAAFVADCESREAAATYQSYTEYAAEHKGAVPSAAAVRKFYGSWNSALASAR